MGCAKDATSGLTYCSCISITDSRFFNISVKLASRYIVYFNSTDYLRYNTARAKCVLTFIEDTDTAAKFWLMGDSFLRSYYTIHNLQT